jgi:hypothetical protein
VRLVRRVPKPPEAVPSDAPKGFGGWFVLVWLGVVISPLALLRAIGESWPFLHDSIYVAVGSGLAEPQPAQWLQRAVLASVAAEWVVLPLSVITFVLMIKRRRTFPSAFVWSTWITVLALTMDTVVFAMATPGDGASVSSAVASLVGSVLSGAIWTAYIRNSVRVQATFLRSDESSAAAGPGGAPVAA